MCLQNAGHFISASISQHIEADTKWPVFRRRHCQAYFLQWKYLDLDSSFFFFFLRALFHHIHSRYNTIQCIPLTDDKQWFNIAKWQGQVKLSTTSTNISKLVMQNMFQPRYIPTYYHCALYIYVYNHMAALAFDARECLGQLYTDRSASILRDNLWYLALLP